MSGRKVISFALPPDVLGILDDLAAKENRNRSGMIRHLILEYARGLKIIDDRKKYTCGRSE